MKSNLKSYQKNNLMGDIKSNMITVTMAMKAIAAPTAVVKAAPMKTGAATAATKAAATRAPVAATVASTIKAGAMKAIAAAAAALIVALCLAAGGSAAYAAPQSVALTTEAFSNIQKISDRVFCSETFGKTLVTKDFNTFEEVKAYGETLDNMVAVGDTLLFNAGRIYTKDGESFKRTTLDGKRHDGIYDLNYWNGIYFGFSYGAGFTYGAVVSSTDGVNWKTALIYNDSAAYQSTSHAVFALKSAAVIHVYEYNWDGDNPAHKSTFYTTSDFINFTKTENEGLPDVYQYDDVFLITAYRQNGLYTRYVTNDAKNFRILVMDGVEQKNVDSWLSTYNNSYFNVLDNALSDEKPLLREDLDVTKFTNGYSGATPPLDNFEIGSLNLRTNKDKYMFGYSETWEGSIAIQLSENGEDYFWRYGDTGLQKIAANGKGQFLVAGGHGGSLHICNITKSRSKYDLDVEPHAFNPDDDGFSCFKYCNDRYLAATFSNELYTSADGYNWKGEARLPSTMNDVIYVEAEKTYYAACNDGIYTSKDLLSFKKSYASEKRLRGICIGETIVAVGNYGTIVSRQSGEWAEATSTELTDSYDVLHSVAYGNGVYVAVGSVNETGWGNCGYVLRSTDHILNWEKSWEIVHDGEEGFETNTNSDRCYANAGYKIIYSNGRFRTTGLNRAANGFYMSSEDGLKWDVEGIYRWGFDIAEIIPDVYSVVRDYDILLFDKDFESINANVREIDHTKWSALIPSSPPEYAMTQIIMRIGNIGIFLDTIAKTSGWTLA